jgi:uncharacterized membrane protein YuzA (DUF378 family)
MCFNAGKLDRALRIVVGVGLLTYGFISQDLIVSVIGAIPLLTGLVGFCPFYPILKINTGCTKE